MTDVFDALVAANSDVISPDSTPIEGELQRGGVDMNPQAAPAAPPPAQAAPQPQPVKETIQIGPPSPAEPAAAPQAAPVIGAQPAQEPQEQPTHIPLQVYIEEKQKRLEERDARARAEYALQQMQAYQQQAQPRLQRLEAIEQEMPKWQGIEAKRAEAEAKAALLEQRQGIAQSAWEQALAQGATVETAKAHVNATVAAWEAQFRQQQMLADIAAQQRRTEFVIQEQFRQRDEEWQRQQQEARTAAWVKETNDRFVSEYEKVMEAVPALKADPALKEVVYQKWIGHIQQGAPVPVAQAAKPYIESLRAQAVATQAGQQTRAEIHHSMVRTTGGGSGTAPVQGARPAGPVGGIAGAMNRFRSQMAAARR